MTDEYGNQSNEADNRVNEDETYILDFTGQQGGDNERHQGTVTALVMIASSLCNYTILTAASKMAPSHVMIMNIVLTAIGVLLGLFVNARYAKMVSLAESDE